MTIYYSPAERGFFDDAIHNPLPADALPITEQLHQTLLQDQTAGAEILPGPDGLPIARKPSWTTETLRQRLHSALNAERLKREHAGFPYRGKRIDSNPASVTRITSAVLAAMAAKTLGAPYQSSWTCADNTEIVLDAAGVIGMQGALNHYLQQLHTYCRRCKEAWANQDFAALSAVDVRIGWPNPDSSDGAME